MCRPVATGGERGVAPSLKILKILVRLALILFL